jgi:hypothetical protein
VLLKAAQSISKHFVGIELKYLFVSRHSLLLPYLHGEGSEAYLEVSDSHTIIHIDTIDKRLRQLGTNRDELKQYGIAFNYITANNIQQQEDFLSKIFQSTFTQELQKRAGQQEQLLVRYFTQEGLMEGKKCAAVDVGWLGTSRLMINKILRRNGANELEMFYFGVRRDVFPPSAGRYTSYFSPEELSTGATGLLENYYSASPYPTTTGYHVSASGDVVPAFPQDKKFCQTEITQANIDAIESIAKELISFNFTDSQSLFAWAKQSIELITHSNTQIDIHPLLLCSKFDDVPFVKHLSLIELIRLVILGECITAFDRGSLILSLPCWLSKPAWNIMMFTKRMRRALYQKFFTNNYFSC